MTALAHNNEDNTNCNNKMIDNDVSLDYVDPELLWKTNLNSVQKSVTADGLITSQVTYVSRAYEFLSTEAEEESINFMKGVIEHHW